MSKAALGRTAPASAPGQARDLAFVDAVISQVLRWGVLLSAAIIVAGIVDFVVQEGVRAILLAPRGIPPGSETDPASLRAVLNSLLPARPAALTDAGLLLLLVTPVVSVAIAAAAFAVRRDWLYVGIAGFVFAMLMVGFAIGRA